MSCHVILLHLSIFSSLHLVFTHVNISCLAPLVNFNVTETFPRESNIRYFKRTFKTFLSVLSDIMFLFDIFVWVSRFKAANRSNHPLAYQRSPLNLNSQDLCSWEIKKKMVLCRALKLDSWCSWINSKPVKRLHSRWISIYLSNYTHLFIWQITSAYFERVYNSVSFI